MTMTLLQLQVLNWWSFSYIISTNLFALLFHFLGINDVRMTAFTHQLLSRKHQRQKSDNVSANIPAAVLRARRCVVRGLCRSRFHSTRRKGRHHVTWCLAKTSYPTSRWDVAVTNGLLQQDGAPSHTARKTETCSVRTFSLMSQTPLFFSLEMDVFCQLSEEYFSPSLFSERENAATETTARQPMTLGWHTDSDVHCPSLAESTQTIQWTTLIVVLHQL